MVSYKILKCKKCNAYTMNEICHICGEATSSPSPARFSPIDSYGKYRRLYKKEMKL
ncbi:MAG: RNA-protein complex protein Nop10 [Methanosarcinaceae archaeon]|nr:RNA-protein complex protein Nop10 [Methanosarcinaceae archaeon]